MVRSPTLAPRWELTQGFKRRFTVKRDADLDDFTNFIQVVDYYGFRENQERLDWYLRDPGMPTIKLSECRTDGEFTDDYDRVIDLYKKYNLTPIAYPLTPESFHKIRLRKVFVPELAPAFPPHIPLIGHRRYRELRQRMGISDTPWTPADFPTDPLPYP